MSLSTTVRVAMLCCSLALITGCSWFTTVKRYRAIEPTHRDEQLQQPAKDPERKVTMDFSHLLVDSTASKPSFKTLWDLQGPGQKQLIRTLDSNSKNADDFTSSLNKKYLKEKDDGALDFTRKRLKLVFSVDMWHPYDYLGGDDKGFSEADRIAYIDYTFTINDNSLHFVSWDRYQTRYATVNIADLSFQTSVSGTLGYGDSASGLAASVSVSGSRTENQHIQYQYIQLSGKLHEDHLQLRSQGTREINLEGNQIVDVTVKFKGIETYLFGLDDVKDGDNYKRPAALDLGLTYARVPEKKDYTTLKADLQYNYAYRHVSRKSKTFFEWDDKIRYYTGTAQKTVDLVLPREIFPGFYYLYKNGHAGDMTARLSVSLPQGAGPTVKADLLFPDRQSADNFLTWLYYYPCPAAELDNPIVFKNHYVLNINGETMTRKKITDINATASYLTSDRYYQ